MTSPTKPPTPNVTAQGSQALLLVALLIGATWVTALLLMVIQTANPVTINRDQVHRSMAIIEARVVALHPGEMEVVAVLDGNFPEGKIAVRNLNQSSAQVDANYFVPLVPAVADRKRIANVYDITPTVLPNSATGADTGLPLIYPANEQTRQLLEEVLK